MKNILKAISENRISSALTAQHTNLSASSSMVIQTMNQVCEVLTEKVIENPTEITEYVISAYMMLMEIGLDFEKVDNAMVQNHIVSLREMHKTFTKFNQL